MLPPTGKHRKASSTVYSFGRQTYQNVNSCVLSYGKTGRDTHSPLSLVYIGLYSPLFPSGVVVTLCFLCRWECVLPKVLSVCVLSVRLLISFALSCLRAHSLLLSVCVSGDAGGRFRRREDLSAGSLQRWSLSSRELHLHRGHRLQGKDARTHTHTHCRAYRLWQI